MSVHLCWATAERPPIGYCMSFSKLSEPELVKHGDDVMIGVF